MKKYLVLFCIVLLSVSCAESSQDLIDTRKADAEKKFEQFYACYDLALTLPPISQDKVNWETEDANGSYGESNVYHIGIESFKDLSEPLEIPLDGMRRRESADMAKMFDIDLSAHKQPHNYLNAEKYSYHSIESEHSAGAILHFLNVKYLMISRNYTEHGAIAVGLESFQKGYVFGEVLVFDVLQTKYLGGYRYEAESADQVSSRSYGSLDANIEADLSMKIQGAIKDGFKKQAPWIKGTFYPS